MNCRRLEHDALLADLGDQLDVHVEQCEDCRHRLGGYERIARVIAAGDSARGMPHDWRRRTMARIYPVPAWRRARVAAGAAAAVAAVVVLVLLFPRPPKNAPVSPALAPVAALDSSRPVNHNPELAMQIVEEGDWRASNDAAAPPWTEHRRFVAHPGEVVHARAIPADAPYFEIRVYRGARDLLLRCPSAGPPDCRDPRGAVFLVPGSVQADAQPPSRQARSLLVWKIPSVGTYQVVFLVSQRPIAGPRGTLDDDVGAATRAGAQVVDEEIIRVH